VTDHPPDAFLEAFLLGDLPEREARAVLAHLLHGCARCGEVMAPLAAMLLRPAEREPQTNGSEYDLPVARAIESALRQARELATDFGATAEEMPASDPFKASRDWQRCEALLAESLRLRHSDPEGMVLLATAAVEFAEALDGADYLPGAREDLQARAWAELGNAYRVADDLAAAESCFGNAIELFQEGTGERQLLARILDLLASLYSAQRKFAEADQLLDAVYRIHTVRRDFHLAGRALVTKGVAKGYGGASEEAVALLRGGINWLDHHRDPQLLLDAVQSLAWFLVDAGRFAEGRDLIAEHRLEASQGRQSLNALKLRWVEGRIAAGTGHAREAESAFRETRAGFSHRNLPYKAALASLDLAALWLGQGRTAEVGRLVEEMLVTFRSLGIRREAIAAILMLQEALRTERATLLLVQAVAKQLRRLEGEPT